MCPGCWSEVLKVRRATGIEWFVVFWSGTRKYLCMDCGRKFRAADRRLVPRAESAEDMAGAVSAAAERSR